MMTITRLKYYIKRLLGRHPYVKTDVRRPAERYGSDYGGWNILAGSVNAGSIVYSIGIGEDISFDLALIAKFGCRVFAYDPTPRVADWLAGQQLPARFDFRPEGIAEEDGSVAFFTPDNPGHISHSARPSAQHKGEALRLQVKKLSTMMRENGHDHIDLLKMDIEGFEYDVIRNLLQEGLKVNQLLVEFHHGMYSFHNTDTSAAIESLRGAGYQLFSISDSGREYSFCR